MKIPEWIISLFEVESGNLDTFLKEFIEMTFDLEAKSIYVFHLKELDINWMNIKKNYSKISQAL